MAQWYFASQKKLIVLLPLTLQVRKTLPGKTDATVKLNRAIGGECGGL